ncbi:diphthamide biosynthesis protein 4 [Apiospora kogelbergensis]|uniref:Diphthamide biosynthesis protein 4 n=1 Tax=Apiospora kogelbergensis TaxID=1337665 RepID=A0AAW0QWG1_9PEZI
MAPPNPRQPKKEPTLFEILALSPQSLQGQDPPTATKSVKQAYRRALLKYHPDKNPQAAGAASDSTAGTGKSALYTVDQITHAYTVLSDTKQRREYARNLQTRTATSSSTTTRTSTKTTSPSSTSRNNTRSQSQEQHHEFKTGVETVDLDDLSWDGKRGMYYRSCRCGQKRGFRFKEDDLEESGEDGELLVECSGCSLSLKVLFEEVTDDEEEDEEEEVRRPPPPQQRQSKGSRDINRANSTTSNMQRTVSQGSGEGQSGRWNWKFSFGISIGGGLGLSAGARTGSS